MSDHPVGVRCEPAPGGWACHVTVGGAGAPTSHDVTVRAEDLERLAPGAADATDLVARSFDFLLAREPKTSILRRFDLTLIGRYFPDWERAIRH